MDRRHLEYLLAVAEQRSVTRAAAALFGDVATRGPTGGAG